MAAVTPKIRERKDGSAVPLSERDKRLLDLMQGSFPLDPRPYAAVAAALGAPEALGGKVLEGTPEIFARIDYAKGPVAAGLFKATKGKILIHFPFTEHATILEGEVTLTDEAGNSHSYKAGDSYFIRQGQVIVWEVKGKQVVKSFFNTVEAP